MWKEAEMLRKLENKYFVKYVNSFPIPKTNSLAILTEYLSGGNLRQYLKS